MSTNPENSFFLAKITSVLKPDVVYTAEQILSKINLTYENVDASSLFNYWSENFLQKYGNDYFYTENILVGFYKKMGDQKYQSKMSIWEILTDIKNAKYSHLVETVRDLARKKEVFFDPKTQKYNESDVYSSYKSAHSVAKGELPCFTLSGIFENNKYKENFIKASYTQFFQIDVDFKENRSLDFDSFRKTLISLQGIVAVFGSPSGNGLKAILKHDAPYSQHEQAFVWVEQFFLDNFEVKIDSQCKNINRVFYVSSDADLFVNKDYTDFHVDLTSSKTLTSINAISQRNGIYSTANEPSQSIFRDIFEMAQSMVNKTGVYFVDGSKSIFRFEFACILNEFGISETEAVGYVCQHFGSNPYNKAILDVEGVYKHKKDKFATKVFAPYKEKITNTENETRNTISLRNGISEIDGETVHLINYMFHGENGFANYIAIAYKKVFCFDTTAKKEHRFWRIFEDGHWKICNKCEFENTVFADLIAQTNQICKENSDENNSDALKAILRRLGTRAFQNNINALSQQKMAVRRDDFDKNPMLLTMADCTLNFDNSQIKKQSHEPADLISISNGIKYDKYAKCPVFEKYLGETFLGDLDLMTFIQQIFGLCLTGITEQKIFFFYGEGGANGKSVLVETMGKLLGDYYLKVGGETFTEKIIKESKKRFCGLEGRRVVVSGEIEESAVLSELALKDLTGKERVEAEYKFENAFNFVPQCKVILFGNYKPVVKGKDNSFYRRFLMIPFLNKVLPENENKNLQKELDGELSGIFMWALKGLNTYFKHGLQIPNAVLKASEAFKNEQANSLSFEEELILEKIKPAKEDSEDRKLLTASDIYALMPEIKNLHILGLKLRKLGFEKKMYKIKGKMYQKYAVEFQKTEEE